MKNYINQYKKTYKRIKETPYKARLKELKTWAQVNGPKPIRGILSYALDWLSPELLGTGFRMIETSDDEIKGMIPYRSSNFDLQSEIHAGLVLNAALELSRVSLQQQMPDETFRIASYEVKMTKKKLWAKDLNLSLKLSQNDFDEFFIELQEKKKSEIVLNIFIGIGSKHKPEDLVQISLKVESVLQIKE